MSSNSSSSSVVATSGMSMGATLAVVISWGLNHSIGWAILHGVFGWFYVIYHWWIGVY